MANFICPYCGMSNIDCEKDGFKTPQEIKYEKIIEEHGKRIKELQNKLDRSPTCDEVKGY